MKYWIVSEKFLSSRRKDEQLFYTKTLSVVDAAWTALLDQKAAPVKCEILASWSCWTVLKNRGMTWTGASSQTGQWKSTSFHNGRGYGCHGWRSESGRRDSYRRSWCKALCALHKKWQTGVWKLSLNYHPKCNLQSAILEYLPSSIIYSIGNKFVGSGYYHLINLFHVFNQS